MSSPQPISYRVKRCYTTMAVEHLIGPRKPVACKTIRKRHCRVVNFRHPWETVFYNILQSIKMRSTCIKHKVAACVVRGTQIISIGYNGTAAGTKECCDVWLDSKEADFKIAHREWSAANEVHAEINALNYVSKNEAHDCALVTLYFPCLACAKHIASHSIRTVYYYDFHSHKDVERSKKILDDARVTYIMLNC
jgi:dCMP deaminase